MKKFITVFLGLMIVAGSSYAQEASYYFGTSYLNAETELFNETDHDSGLEARLGYIINSNFAFEVNYSDFGALELPLIPDAGGSVETDGYSIAVLGSYPLGTVNLVGKLGYLWWESEGILGSIAGPRRYSDSGSDAVFGVGLSYKLTDTLELKAEHNESQEANWNSIGLNFHF